jgi:hypothetical protein
MSCQTGKEDVICKHWSPSGCSEVGLTFSAYWESALSCSLSISIRSEFELLSFTRGCNPELDVDAAMDNGVVDGRMLTEFC